MYVTEEAAETVTEQVRETVGIREQIENRNETVLVTGDCLLDHGSDLIDPFLDRHDCLVLYPLRYENGDKICRIRSLTAATLTECYRELTDRQSQAIHCAYEHGYYEIPREVTTDRVADEMGIEHRTAEEHLRRAENTLLAPMIDLLN